MVIIKSNKAVGSILGLGTHTWLEITHNGEKTTYSGSKGRNNILAVLKNYKRDYNREPKHGSIAIPPPKNISQDQWAQKVIHSANIVLADMHHNYTFSGIFPYGTSKNLPRANCCTVISNIIHLAGATIPNIKLKGFTPGLKRRSPQSVTTK